MAYQKPHEDDIEFLINKSLDNEVRPKVIRIGTMQRRPNGSWVNTEDKNCLTKIDEVSSTVTYLGRAAFGIATSDALWQIRKISTSGTVTTIAYAGQAEYNQVWDNRASLTYE